MATKKSKGYKVDFVNRVITVTKEFHHRASNDSNEEHALFRNLVNELPGFRVAFTATRKRKPTRDRLTYEKMIEYICRQEGSENLLREFNEIRTPKESLTHAPYPYVKRWFLARFPYYNQMTPFDTQGRILDRKTQGGGEGVEVMPRAAKGKDAA